MTIAKLLCICACLWTGTLAYHVGEYLILHRNSLLVTTIDQCWFEFVGALAVAMACKLRLRAL